MADMTKNNDMDMTLVLGGTGKTGRRVADGLRSLDRPVRIGSRSGAPPFDWDDRSTWTAALRDVGAAYVVYYPDVSFPGAADTIGAFTAAAVDAVSGAWSCCRGEAKRMRCQPSRRCATRASSRR